MSEKQESWVARIADKLSNNVQPVDSLTGAFEAIVLAFTGPLATWLIAVPNIWLVVKWSEGLFGFDWRLSWPIAIGFEMVGASLSNLWSSCRQWNATEQDEKKRMVTWFALLLMCLYFAIDLTMVFLLGQQSFSNVQVRSEYLNLIFPVVVIIAALAANERTTLYRLRRERDELQEEQGPRSTEWTNWQTEIAELHKLLDGVNAERENYQLKTAKYADFEAALAKLNGGGAKFLQDAKPKDVVAFLEGYGRGTSPTSAGKFLAKKRAEVEVN